MNFTGEETSRDTLGCLGVLTMIEPPNFRELPSADKIPPWWYFVINVVVDNGLFDSAFPVPHSKL